MQQYSGTAVHTPHSQCDVTQVVVAPARGVERREVKGRGEGEGRLVLRARSHASKHAPMQARMRHASKHADMSATPSVHQAPIHAEVQAVQGRCGRQYKTAEQHSNTGQYCTFGATTSSVRGPWRKPAGGIGGGGAILQHRVRTHMSVHNVRIMTQPTR